MSYHMIFVFTAKHHVSEIFARITLFRRDRRRKRRDERQRGASTATRLSQDLAEDGDDEATGRRQRGERGTEVLSALVATCQQGEEKIVRIGRRRTMHVGSWPLNSDLTVQKFNWS